MPEFVLRYKQGTTDQEEQLQLEQAKIIAEAVEQVAGYLFGKEVVWEIQPFGISKGQPDFSVTGWITDNDDRLHSLVLRVQKAVLEEMQHAAFSEQTVECWWQRVKGKWSAARGLIDRT